MGGPTDASQPERSGDAQASLQNVSSAAAGGDGVRVATVTVDRPCSKCGFNLVGQPIIRERHYGLFISRCPECGTVALIRGTGSGGAGPRQWAAVAGAVMLFVALAAILGLYVWAVHSAAFIAAPKMLAHHATEITDRQAAVMRTAVEAVGGNDGVLAAVQAMDRPAGERSAEGSAAPVLTGYPVLDEHILGPARVLGSYVPQRVSVIDRQWWADQDKATVVRDACGVVALLGTLAVWDWLRPLLLSFLVGLLLAVVLWHRSRGWVLVLLLLPAALSIAAMLIWPPPVHDRPARPGGAWIRPEEAAFEVIWPWVGLVIVGAAWAAAAAAVLAGRPLARLACSLFLPPRLNHTLAMLWAGRGPPRGR